MVTKTFLYFIEFIPYSLLEIVKKLVLYAILIRLLIFLNDCNIYTIIMKGYAKSYSMRLNLLNSISFPKLVNTTNQKLYK